MNGSPQTNETSSSDLSQANHKCDVCPKTFPRKCYLALHSVVHEEPKNCICSVCGRVFKQRKDVLIHMKCHKTGNETPKPSRKRRASEEEKMPKPKDIEDFQIFQRFKKAPDQAKKEKTTYEFPRVLSAKELNIRPKKPDSSNSSRASLLENILKGLPYDSSLDQNSSSNDTNDSYMLNISNYNLQNIRPSNNYSSDTVSQTIVKDFIDL